MARNNLTALLVVNQALRRLGSAPITSFSADTKEAQIADAIFVPTRDLVNHDFGWHWATKRTTLYAYSEPDTTLTPAATTGDSILFTAGDTEVFDLESVGRTLAEDGDDGEAEISALVTSSPSAILTPGGRSVVPGSLNVQFTASASVFAGNDEGKIIENRSTNGSGSALITSYSTALIVYATILDAFDSDDAIGSGDWRLVYTDRVQADISTAFASTSAIASGDWRLYNATPNWHYSFSLKVPDDCLRILTSMNREDFQVEGEYLVADSDNLEVLYIQRQTNLTRWSPQAIEALVLKLMAELAEPITGRLDKAQAAQAEYERRLRAAKARDGFEGIAAPVENAVNVRVSQ